MHRNKSYSDWGTQFGKLIYAYKNWGEHEVIAKDPISELLKLYVKFHNEAEDDPSFEEKARRIQKVEDGDEQNEIMGMVPKNQP